MWHQHNSSISEVFEREETMQGKLFTLGRKMGTCLPHKLFNGLKEGKSPLSNPKEIPLHL